MWNMAGVREGSRFARSAIRDLRIYRQPIYPYWIYQPLSNLSSPTHWAYGTGWGVPRAAMGALGVPGPMATVAHFAVLWGTALMMLPALGVAPPVQEWDEMERAKDALLYLVYVAAAGVTYE